MNKWEEVPNSSERTRAKGGNCGAGNYQEFFCMPYKNAFPFLTNDTQVSTE